MSEYSMIAEYWGCRENAPSAVIDEECKAAMEMEDYSRSPQGIHRRDPCYYGAGRPCFDKGRHAGNVALTSSRQTLRNGDRTPHTEIFPYVPCDC